MSETTHLVEPREGPIRHAENLIALRRFADALHWIERAIAADPQSARPHCLLAFALLHLGQYRRALQTAETAVSHEPENWWPHGLRSVCLRQLGKKRLALEAAQEAARLGPDVPEALNELVAAQLGCNQMRAARTTAERLGAIAPDNVFTHEALGLVALALRQFSSAETHFRRALALDPQDVDILNNLGVALQRQALHPLNWLGDARLRRGKHLEALERFHDAARLEPTSAYIKTNLQAALGWYLRPMVLLIVLGALVVLWGRLDHSHSPLAPVALLAIAAVAAGWLLWRRARIRALPEHLAVLVRHERMWAPLPTDRDRAIVVAAIFAVAIVGAALVSIAIQLAEGRSGLPVFVAFVVFVYIPLVVVVLVWARRKLGRRSASPDDREQAL